MADAAVVIVLLTLAAMTIAPVVVAVYAAVKPDSLYVAVDQSKLVWILVVLFVPLGWAAYLVFFVPKVRRVRPARVRTPGPDLMRGEAEKLYAKGIRSDEVMAALRRPRAAND